MFVCVCERERKRETETERDRESACVCMQPSIGHYSDTGKRNKRKKSASPTQKLHTAVESMATRKALAKRFHDDAFSVLRLPRVIVLMRPS